MVYYNSLTKDHWRHVNETWDAEWKAKIAKVRARSQQHQIHQSVTDAINAKLKTEEVSVELVEDIAAVEEDDSSKARAEHVEVVMASLNIHGEVKGKFIVCDHCHSHGLPCDEDAVCEQCILHGVASVHHWCKLSKNKKDECPRVDCRYVHKDYMPTSEALAGVEWLVIPGNMRGYMSAGRKGRKYGDRDDRSDSDSDTDSDFEFVDVCCGREISDIKAIQADGLDELTSCVARGDASWETVILTCACLVEEEDQHEQKLRDKMAKNRRGDVFTVRYQNWPDL